MAKKNKAGRPRKGPVMTGEALKRWRMARKLTQARLAEFLDVSEFTIFCYERGRGARGEELIIPRRSRLALAALANGVMDYDGTNTIGPVNIAAMLPDEPETESSDEPEKKAITDDDGDDVEFGDPDEEIRVLPEGIDG